MKMYQLIEWFQVNYPELHNDLLQCNHNFDETDLNPYHLESDCWSHTMMVCKIAELQGYGKVVQIAALLHDIGKPKSRDINPRNKHVRFFNHENISSYLAIDVLKKMLEEKMITTQEMSDIHILIAYHGELYRNTNPKSIYEKFKFDERLYLLLKQVSYCDNLGRFSPDLRTTETEVIQAATKYFEHNFEVKQCSKTEPYVELLCGVSKSSKISYLKNIYKDKSTTVFDSKDQKGEFMKALQEKKNIVVNLPNLTVLDRSIWLKYLPMGYRSKAKIFLDTCVDLEVQIIKNFVYPLYDEVEEFSFV